MRKYCRSIVVAISFLMLAACHTSEIENPFSPRSNDDAITTSIHESLLHHRTLAKQPIEVRTNHGVVMLSGHVRTIRQSDTAERVAKHTAGVKSVQNDLVVRK